jgi:RNA polymerase sigma factor (sigma-70 family)
MTPVSNERALWLARHILPAEPALRAWLARRPRVGLEIDDIIQETYAVLAGLQHVDHIQSPRTYAFQVAKTVILQALRRSQVVSFEVLAEADGLAVSDGQPSPEDQLADRQELGRAAALIAVLPAKCREAFTLRKVHGLSQREVAQRMGISENTVEKHVGKALGLLMAAMGRGGTARIAASRRHDLGSDHSTENRKQRGD